MLLTFYNDEIKTLITNNNLDTLKFLVNNNGVSNVIVVIYSIELNNYDIFYYFYTNYLLTETYYNWYISYAAKYNRINIITELVKTSDFSYEVGFIYSMNSSTTLIDYFLNLGCNSYNEAMVLAIRYNNITNVIYLDNKLGNGVLNYNAGLYYSTTQEFIDFFVGKGATVGEDINYYCRWCEGLEVSALENSPELVKFFLDQGSDNYNSAMYNSARNENRELMDFFLDLGANNLNDIISVGVYINSLKVINYCLDNGVVNIQNALKTAIDIQSIEMIDYLLGKNLTVDYDEIIEYASSLGLTDIVKHLTEWQ